ncbi:MAG: 2-oxoacid:acceptor oxidoreductase subunit alpha, partial [Anaerolineaceae bacterium]|nr:2-oxoacid:acceptor oxidoreductase subunit alpha [Anaerolineaceae bacterium]
CFEFGWKSLDLAERLQTPVIVLSDLDMGMNQWMTEPFRYPEIPLDRGKILWEEDLDKMLERFNGQWGRYLDIDGDGITYRTLPGNRHRKAAFFTRGTGHDEFARYSEEPEVWEKLMGRLARKYVTAKQHVPKPILRTMPGANVGIIAVGSTEMAVEEARHFLAEAGLPTDFMRVRAVPFTEEVDEFIDNHNRIYVVEINRDGQLRQLLLVNNPGVCDKLKQVSHSDGMPLSARWVKDEILAQEEKR